MAAILLAVLAVTFAAMPATREHAFGYEHAGRYAGLRNAKVNDGETWVLPVAAYRARSGGHLSAQNRPIGMGFGARSATGLQCGGGRAQLG